MNKIPKIDKNFPQISFCGFTLFSTQVLFQFHLQKGTKIMLSYSKSLNGVEKRE